MSEVKRVNIDFSGLQGPADSISTGHPDAGVFYAAKYEAQRLRADTAEADLLRTSDALIAAEKRIANHESTLRRFANCADVRQVGTSAMEYVAALNPNPEAESHE